MKRPGDATHLDHIGIAVRSLAERLPFYRDLLGLEHAREEEVPTERVRVAFLERGETHIELLEPLGGDGPIADFLGRRGEGIHHLCFAVDDIEAALARAREAGVAVVGEAPRPGAGGCRVAFLHPKSTGGILIELSETPRKG
jgi:methylmalonyl-CoA/ethylmalonyl-CoA epimerase